MSILRNKIFSVCMVASLLCSSCSGCFFSSSKINFYDKVKNVITHVFSFFRGKTENASDNTENVAFLVGGGAFLAVFGWFCYYLGKRNSNGGGGTGPTPPPTNPVPPRRKPRCKPPKNWADIGVKVNELLRFTGSRGIITRTKRINVDGVDNRIYQLRSSGQKGAQCGPSALCNASRLNLYFDGKKGYQRSLAEIVRLNDGSTKKQIKKMKRNKKVNVEWLLFDELVRILQGNLIEGLELNKNVFIFPALPFYLRRRVNINDAAKPLYDLNIKKEKDGFSCSFIVPDFTSEATADRGHWICVHVVKTGNTLSWFIVCSMNGNILQGEWWEKIEFMIHMLLDVDASQTPFGSSLLGEKLNVHATSLSDMSERIAARTTRRGLHALRDELDGMKMLLIFPGGKQQLDTYRAIIDVRLADIPEEDIADQIEISAQ